MEHSNQTNLEKLEIVITGMTKRVPVDLGGHFGRLFEFNCTVLDHKWCQRGGTWEDQERIGKQEGKSKEEAEQEGKREEQGSEKGEHGRKRKEAGKKQRRTEKEPARMGNE